MPTSELMLKFVSNLGEVNTEAFNRGLNEFEKTCAFAAGHKLKRLPLYLEDGGGMDAIALRSRIVTMVQQFGIKVVFVDYLQLMPYVQGQERKSTLDALGETARLLKSIAKETGVCIVAMSQLSKETEKNRLAKPQLANLRDSGKLEDNADRVLFVWRPIYHGFDTVDYKGGEINTVGKACIIQAKFRHGNIGEAWTKAELQYSKFSTLENAFERIEDPFWEEISSTQSPNAGLDTPF
jgi:replicative DNA helicase